jgi:hypothetical protein
MKTNNPTPIVMSREERKELTTLIEETKSLRLRGRDLRIETGRLLLRIHAIKSKPGYGKFIQTVTEEIGMPYTTARDYMREAQIADGHYEIRNGVEAEDHDPVVDYDPNDGQLDEVEKQVAIAKAQLAAAVARDNDATLRRDFCWKFQGLTLAMRNQLCDAKLALGSVAAAKLLIAAAKTKETSNAKIAA